MRKIELKGMGGKNAVRETCTGWSAVSSRLSETCQFLTCSYIDVSDKKCRGSIMQELREISFSSTNAKTGPNLLSQHVYHLAGRPILPLLANVGVGV